MSVLEHQDILQVVELRVQQAEIKALQLENEVCRRPKLDTSVKLLHFDVLFKPAWNSVPVVFCWSFCTVVEAKEHQRSVVCCRPWSDNWGATGQTHVTPCGVQSECSIPLLRTSRWSLTIHKISRFVWSNQYFSTGIRPREFHGRSVIVQFLGLGMPADSAVGQTGGTTSTFQLPSFFTSSTASAAPFSFTPSTELQFGSAFAQYSPASIGERCLLCRHCMVKAASSRYSPVGATNFLVAKQKKKCLWNQQPARCAGQGRPFNSGGPVASPILNLRKDWNRLWSSSEDTLWIAVDHRACDSSILDPDESVRNEDWLSEKDKLLTKIWFLFKQTRLELGWDSSGSASLRAWAAIATGVSAMKMLPSPSLRKTRQKTERPVHSQTSKWHSGKCFDFFSSFFFFFFENIFANPWMCC